MKTTLTAVLAAFALVWALPAPVQADTAWPTKTVRIVVPYAAGSAPDMIARLIFARIEKSTGKTMVVDNKPGAAGMIGTDRVAKAMPDGTTLVIGPSGPLGVNALLYKKMSYDPVKDLAPVALVAETPTILVASNATAANDAAELLKAMARAKGHIAYASPGAGTLGHLNMAYLVNKSGATDIPHVPYPGSPQIIAALIADDVQLAALPPLAVLSYIKSGKIKAIATIGPHRSPALPNLPTLKEQGIDFEPVGWFGIETAAGTPPDVVEAIHRQISAALKDEEVASTYRTLGLDVVDKGPKAFADYIAHDLAQWKPVIQHNAIALD